MIRVHDLRPAASDTQSAAIAMLRERYPALQFVAVDDAELQCVTAFKFRLRVSLDAADWLADLDARIAKFREQCQIGLNITERAK